MFSSFVFLDLETTGLNPDIDEIIEIGAILVKNEKIIRKFSTFVKPNQKIPLRIQKLTGIKPEMLDLAPGLEKVHAEFIDFIADYPVIGHNISFDITFLERKGIILNNPIIDTLDLIQIVLPEAPSYRLENIKNDLGLGKGNSHRAVDDAESAYQVFFKCLNFLMSQKIEVLFRVKEFIDDVQSQWSLGQFLSYHLNQQFKNFPSDIFDTPFAYLRNQEGENDSLFKSNSDEDADPRPDFESLGQVLGPSGPFSKNFPGYNYRPVQLKILETVMQGMRENRHVVIEAGTGTGKSLAYLVPAVAWAVANKTKVVIATHTINLQEQLWEKDLPGLKNAWGFNFRSAIVKGRSNYLCLRRWETKSGEPVSSSAEAVFLLKTLVWLTSTVTGDKSEINILPSQFQFWNELKSEQDACLGVMCPWYKLCFVTKARRQAEGADLLIVNHSLLMSDIKYENRILPPYDYLIIDEAHHLEESATEHLGWSLSINSLKMFFLSLIRGFGHGLPPGLLNQFKRMLKDHSGVDECFDAVKRVIEALDDMDSSLNSWILSKSAENHDEDYVVLRICEQDRISEPWNVLITIKDNLLSRISVFINNLNKISDILNTPENNNSKNKNTLYLAKEGENIVNYLKETKNNIELFFSGSQNSVFWVEKAGSVRGESIILRFAPVSVSDLLYETLFKNKKSVLLTSATLSVDGSFEYFTDRVGLSHFPQNSVIKEMFSSPFNYDDQALLCVVRDLPDPVTCTDFDYANKIAPVIADLVRIYNGRTLVLFTSHKLLRETYLRLEREMEKDGFILAGHKIDGGRSRLIEEFRKGEISVLFGASSFWEGINLPGGVLKCVVIVKLPFAPPTSPLIESRVEQLTQKGKDAFYVFNLPEAVIKFKQGFGRLIRSETDNGTVVVLDRRIVDRVYGRKFLNSLPLKMHFKGDISNVLQKISDWENGERPSFSSLNIFNSLTELERHLKLM